jgi:hypothetical protein
MPYLKQLTADFPPLWPGFDARPDYVGFMVDMLALGQVFSEYGKSRVLRGVTF